MSAAGVRHTGDNTRQKSGAVVVGSCGWESALRARIRATSRRHGSQFGVGAASGVRLRSGVRRSWVESEIRSDGEPWAPVFRQDVPTSLAPDLWVSSVRWAPYTADPQGTPSAPGLSRADLLRRSPQLRSALDPVRVARGARRIAEGPGVRTSVVGRCHGWVVLRRAKLGKCEVLVDGRSGRSRTSKRLRIARPPPIFKLVGDGFRARPGRPNLSRKGADRTRPNRFQKFGRCSADLSTDRRTNRQVVTQ